MRQRAFTLIELLIVVAIIAILAAIALPNFLEAQTRAKVARTRADMRSMATAVETYRIDHNLYPIPMSLMAGTTDVVYPMPSPMHLNYDHNWLPPAITTPTSYITSIFADVFADEGLLPQPEQRFLYYQSWEYTGILAEEMGMTFPEAMSVRDRAFGSWVMFADGPDRDRKDMAPARVGPTAIINGVYDATNGTVSNGDIIRTQRSGEGIVL